MPSPKPRLLALGALALLLFVAWPRRAAETPAPTPSAQQRNAQRAAAVAPSIQEHWTYPNRLRQTDKFSTVVAPTLLNSENQLGVGFYVSVSDDKIPEQIDQIMTEMAKHFPKDSVTVEAYGASSPLHPGRDCPD